MPIKDKNAKREYSRKWMQKKRMLDVEPDVEPATRTIETQTDIIIKGNGTRFLADKFDEKIIWSWSLIIR